MNRRELLFATAFAAVSKSTSPVLAKTPAAQRSINTGVTGVVIDHFRIVEGNTSPLDSVVLGALVNESNSPVDVPDLLQCTVRDLEGTIVGDGFVLTDYPILIPGVKVGFQVELFDLAMSEIDASRTKIEPRFGETKAETRLVEYLASHPISIDSATESKRDKEGFEATIQFTNAGAQRLENSVSVYVSIWDRAGQYCGHVYANALFPVDPGESARVETVLATKKHLPLRVAGDDFSWEALVAAR